MGDMPLRGSCHCGAIAFEVDAQLPDALTRCTCSFCAKRGALYAYCKPEQFKLDQHATQSADDKDAVYLWHTKLVSHHFCSHCGIATYTDSPDFQPDGSWDGITRRFGVNARLFEGFEAAEAKVLVIDGKNLW